MPVAPVLTNCDATEIPPGAADIEAPVVESENVTGALLNKAPDCVLTRTDTTPSAPTEPSLGSSDVITGGTPL